MTAINLLTDARIRNVKTDESKKRLNDGGGVYLLLDQKNGAHRWRFDYSIHGSRKTLSLGVYPATGLQLAREKAEAFRKLVAEGVDPSAHRKEAKRQQLLKREAEAQIAQGLPVKGSFEQVAREWFDIRREDWSLSYSSKVIRRLEVDVFPWVGSKPVNQITVPEILEVLRRIESRGVVETAHRTRESCGQIFRYAIACGLATNDPTIVLRDALRKPVTKNMAAITDPVELAGLLRAIDGYIGSLVVRTALRVAPMLLVRPGELRFAAWDEFDFETDTWTIPAVRMKREKEGKEKGEPHIVPLAPQVVTLLKDLQGLTGRGKYVFRGERDHGRAMSENTINAALRQMGYDTQNVMTGHGFRATARTILDEILGFDEKLIEVQLAHAIGGSLGTAYNRAKYLIKRREMMVGWADYLEELKSNPPLSLSRTV